ncbi:MAG: topoisomerase C-terminal repeat-containing protein [Oscillospiraceae bacterium]|nr:topoisomerase C-terminal repeat-containing protein [Oscillospiraceae bacterium]
MILIIAEKPSLGRNIAAGIGGMKSKNGYLEGSDYLITWGFGHLFSLCDIEDYTGKPKKTRWNMEDIPCFPSRFQFALRKEADGSVDPGVQRQFDLICSLINREDVDTVVNAGDADREGEIIIRLIIAHAMKTPKRQLRLWLPDQTPQTVQAALKSMKESSGYDNLANEGFARTYIDWLYGVNLTRYATLKSGMLLRVGRVIVPIVKAIYDRDMAIRNFVPDIYYGMVSKAETNGVEVELTSKQKFEKDKLADCQRECGRYNASRAVVTARKNKKDTIKPGKLYSLSKLQNVLGKKYKMPMDQSLKVLQGLYEKGYVTYPRTNSEYLATAEKDKIRQILQNVAKLGYPVEFKDAKTIFDDSKIESHSALTPTYKLPQKGQLSEDEYKVYQTVFRRFVAVFCSEDCIAQRSELTVSVKDCEDFTLKGMVITQPGWTKYDDYTSKNKILPPLKKGDIVNIDFAPKEKETSPPRHYTIETLNNYLKNPFKEDKAKKAEDVDEDDTADYKAIFEGLELGTEATRTGIIDNARKSGYIELKKDVYTILPGGEYLIEQLQQMQIQMDKYKTSTLGQALKKVYRGEMSVTDSVDLAKAEIRQVFAHCGKQAAPETDTDTGFYGDKVGKCPLCGKDVVRGRYSYGCTGYKEGCNFKLNMLILKRAISLQNAKMLLNNGKTSLIRGFTSKNGKSFDAYLALKEGKVVFEFENER